MKIFGNSKPDDSPTPEEQKKIDDFHRVWEEQQKGNKEEAERRVIKHKAKKRQDMRNYLAIHAPPFPDSMPHHWSLEVKAQEIARWRYAYADAMLAELEGADSLPHPKKESNEE